MRVAVAYETGQPLVLEDLPVPAIGPRDVLVRVTASGICHTDLNVINGLSALPLPIVPGHEGCGIVEETGPEVRRVRPGDRGPRLGHPRLRHLLVVRQRHVQPLRAEPGGEGRAPVRARHGQRAAAVCGCGTFAEAMVVHEASVVPVQTDLATPNWPCSAAASPPGWARPSTPPPSPRGPAWP